MLGHGVTGWLITLLATVMFATFPNYPQIITEALSEKAVLSYAHEHGWHFGTDIVFTYGPLGFLSSRYFFVHAWPLRFVLDLLFSFAVCGGVTRLAWRMPRTWRWLLIGTFVFLGANIDPRYDLLVYIGIFSWAVLCFLDSGRQLFVDCAGLAAIVAFGVLVKANFLFLAGVTLVALAGDLFVRRKSGMALALLLAFGVCFLCGWFAAGQGWRNLLPFFSHILPLASGYNQAVALDGMEILRSRGFIAITLLALAAFIRAFIAFESPVAAEVTRLQSSETTSNPEKDGASLPRLLRGNERKEVRGHPGLRRLILAVWLAGVLLLIWKHGFVRGDMFHMGFFFGFSPFCALALEGFSAQRSISSKASRIFAMACWAVVIFTLQRWCFPAFPTSLLQPFHTLSANGTILWNPSAFQRRMLDEQDREFSKLELPKTRQITGTAVADVFGQDQLYALCNHLNYRPRPIFQSYMAYNSHLSRLNEQFYLSSNAPECVLFRLTPIDRKFPALEDSLVLRDLLLNYGLEEEEPPYLVLKRKSTMSPRLTLLRESTVQVGERIDLTSFGETNIWMQIELRPSFAGRLRGALYKPGVVRLKVWTGNTKAPYKAPAPMLAAGFVASPLLLSDSDVREFYRGGKLTRPDAYSIGFDAGGEALWAKTFLCRIYTFESAAASQ
jgi:hypothetical protein